MTTPTTMKMLPDNPVEEPLPVGTGESSPPTCAGVSIGSVVTEEALATTSLALTVTPVAAESALASRVVSRSCASTAAAT